MMMQSCIATVLHLTCMRTCTSRSTRECGVNFSPELWQMDMLEVRGSAAAGLVKQE